MEASAIPPELQALVGLELPSSAVEIDRASVRMWARSTGETNPIYYDVESARRAGHPDLPCPPGFLGRYAYVPGLTDPTSSVPATASFLPPVPADFTQNLHGSLGVRTFRRLYAGEQLTATSRIEGVSEREGRLGRMIRVDTLDTYRDAAGAVVAEKFDTVLFYR